MIGYTKCPKCHAPMPGVSSSSRMKRASMGGGGTTAEREELPPVGGGGSLLWIIGVLVLGAGIAVWATQCRGGSKNRAPAAAVVDEAPTVGTAAPPPSVEDQRAVPSQTGGPDPSFAADALEGELAGERLFATVAVLGELLDVRSAFCADARLGEIIGRHAGELKNAGVQRVRCSETYGTQVFERPL